MKIKSFMPVIRQSAIVLLFLIASGSTLLAYTVTAGMEPTNLTITLRLDTEPIHNNFTRFLKFENLSGAVIAVGLDFKKTANLVYTGTVTPDGLNNLKSIVAQNMRSYWDKMYFVNAGGSTALDIGSMEVWIEYGNHTTNGNGNWDPDVLIAYETNKYLDAGNDSFSISQTNGRRKYIRDYFGWSNAELDKLPQSILSFVYDLGKSGSSGTADSSSADNPKYGLSGQNLCSEIVSWYYYESGIRIADMRSGNNNVYDFRDIAGNDVMLNQFQYGGKRYDYDAASRQWVYVDPYGNTDFGKTTMPQPGDYLNRHLEHAMMILNWDETNKVAHVLDGPFPITIREVPINVLEANGKQMAIGKLPENAAWRVNSRQITQGDSSYWQAESYYRFMVNPILVMGPPSYEGDQPATIRVRNVNSAGFEFQVDEWNYLDGSHVRESVDYMVLEEGLHVIYGMQVEAGKISTDHNWVTVPITGSFSGTPVVLAQCVTYNGSDAVTVRIRNVTRTSFQVKIQEEEAGGNHTTEMIHYAVFAEGRYGNFDVRRISGVTDSWTRFNGATGVTGASIMGNIQTYNGSDPAALRKNWISGTNYDLKVEEEQSADSETSHTGEVVGVVACYYLII